MFPESTFLNVVSQEQSSSRNESTSGNYQSEFETTAPSTSKQINQTNNYVSKVQLKTTPESQLKAKLVESKSSLLVSEPDLDANKRRSKRTCVKSKETKFYRENSSSDETVSEIHKDILSSRTNCRACIKKRKITKKSRNVFKTKLVQENSASIQQHKTTHLSLKFQVFIKINFKNKWN